MSQPVDYAFLHGGGQGSWVWAETLEALRRQTDGDYGRALLLDVPGCGAKRARATEGLTVDDIVAELIGDLEAARFRDVVLVGHSQAGNILPKIVQARPDLLRRVVYISCSSPLPGQTVVEMMGSGLHGQNPDEVGWPLDPATTSMEERFRVMFCNDMSPSEGAAFLARLGQDSWPAQCYAAVDWRYDGLEATPATYVACLRDGILPVAWQKAFAARYKADRLVRVDSGHQVMNTRPHTLAEILRLEALA